MVYNTSAYDSLASLRLLDRLVDIYMRDFKFWSRDTAKRLCTGKDYLDRARTGSAWPSADRLPRVSRDRSR
jgi:putative pyruvate formate lyase activating enzyme